MTIEANHFHTWKADPTTLEVMTKVSALVDQIKVALTDPNVLMGEQKQVAKLLGNKEALELILNMKYSDLEDVPNENSPSRT